MQFGGRLNGSQVGNSDKWMQAGMLKLSTGEILGLALGSKLCSLGSEPWNLPIMLQQY